MSFIKRLVILAIIAGALALGYLFIFKKSAVAVVNSELSKISQILESRNDGSSLRYGTPQVAGNVVTLNNVQYVEGKSQTVYEFGQLISPVGAKGIRDMIAKNVIIKPKKGEPASIALLDIKGFVARGQKFEFDEILLSRIQLNGHIVKSVNAEMKIAAIHLSEARNQIIKNITVEDLSLGAGNSPARLSLEKFELKNVNIDEVFNTINNLEKGNLPLGLLQSANLNNKQLATLNALLSAQASGGIGNIDNAELFDFIIKNAPAEFQDFLGTTDGGEIAGALEELENLPPEEQAIKGLEFFLKALKNEKNRGSQ